MKNLKQTSKTIFQNSIFGALFTLWTAPIDDEKLEIPSVKNARKSNFFLDNLIIAHKP
ncbi:MAG: hypothetical protein NUV73_00435 [Candidatus Daviesbacteria bacterium]|nr:hypothetical protein [Candidatus Daviesbacteria bacterium]